MNILLVDDDDSIRQYVILLIEDILGEVSISEAVDANQAIKKIEQKDFDLIVSDFEMPGGNGDILYHYFVENNFANKYISFTSLDQSDLPDFPSKENFNYILKSGNFNETKANFSIVLNVEKIDHEYLKVRTTYFWRYNKSLCDVYIRLSEKKFVKVINADDIFDKEQIDNYFSKGVSHLYIKREDAEKFSDSIRSRPFLKFEGEFDPLVKQKMTVKIIHEIALEVGVTNAVVEMVDNLIEDIKKGDNQLQNLLNTISESDEYIIDHSYLMSYLGVGICESLGWVTRNSREKICYASLFHDIELKTRKLADIKTTKDIEFENLSKEEKQLVLNHPLKAVLQVDFLEEKYPGIEKIIMQHHERPDGSGFPRGLKENMILPLSAGFIVVHDLVNYIYDNDFKIDNKENVIKELSKYSTGQFKKVADVLIEKYL